MPNRMPERIELGRKRDFTIETLEHFYQKHLDENDIQHEHYFIEAERQVCGFPLPDFQRGLCWSAEQEVSFIESIWMGLPLGYYVIHDYDWGTDGKAKQFSGWLIDGQQRLTAIERYWNGLIQINGLFYHELTEFEKRRFLRTPFTQYRVIINDEAKIKDLYNRLSFGGTPHRLDQRAV